MSRRALGAVPMLACAAALGFPAASGAIVAGPTHLTVSPGRTSPRGDVLVRFDQPEVGGLLPSQRITETLAVSGPARAGCASGTGLTLPSAAGGATMRERLRPAGLTGGRWCTGTFRVALQVAEYDTCTVGVELHVCAQYVVVPTTVATARFRVVAPAG